MAGNVPVGIFLDMDVERDSPMLSQGPGSGFQTRIETFREFSPPTSAVGVRDLAEDGFHYTSKSGKLICDECCFTISHWLPDEDPRIKHWLANPKCTMANTSERRRFFATPDKRELTYPDNWEVICCFSKTRLASAGFCYVGRKHAHEDIDLVWCFSCDINLHTWCPDDDPLKSHKKGCGLAQMLSYDAGDVQEQLSSGYESEITSDIRLMDDVPTIP